MPCIYETINLKNKEDGINPYRYIGSDQHNKSWYFGSNKKLKEDIKNIGKQFFTKKILFQFDEISNVDLRGKESEIQFELDCANDITYYNKTNASVKGYILTDDDRKEKSIQLRKDWVKWRNSLNDTSVFSFPKDLSKRVRTIEYWIESYGEELGKIKFQEFTNKMSDTKKGELNGMSKYSDETKRKCVDMFFKKNMKRKDICTETGISYGILKLIIRNYKISGEISTKCYPV